MTPNTTTPFRFTGLWQWNPVSCVTARAYDEKYMMAHDDWFFDRAFMTRYFDALRAAGINTWVLANTHPFPFMVDLGRYPEAVVLSSTALQRYQAHYHWLFETARAKGLQPFVLFHTCYVPDRLGDRYNIRPTNTTAFTPPPLAYEYTRHCVRLLCETYPELAGLYGEASENVGVDSRASFARDAIVAGIHESSRRPCLFFRGWVSDPVAMKTNVLDIYEGECFFTVKYTWEFLVHQKPDPEFKRWVDTCGAERVMPEFWISNYQPFGCHDTELARAIHRSVRSLGCPGFTSHPMDLYGAPFVQGEEGDVLQAERDRDWYAALSAGAGTEAGRPESAPLVQAACRPLQRISLYQAGNKQNFLQPQWLAAIGGGGDRRAGLHTFLQWENLPALVDKSYGRWMEQLEGIPVRYPGESGAGFGLADLLKELAQLDAAGEAAPERPSGASSADGTERGAPQAAALRQAPDHLRRAGACAVPLRTTVQQGKSMVDTCPSDHVAHDSKVASARRRDLLGLRCMARAWAARAEAVEAHFAGRREEALSALRRSHALVIQMPTLVGFDGPYRLLVGRHTLILRWSELADALAREMDDYARGTPAPYYFFGQAEHYATQGKDFAERQAGPVTGP